MKTTNASLNWNVPVNPPELKPGHVDVWRVFIPGMASLISPGIDQISGEERERADRFLRSKDRDAFIISHAVLRHVLAMYTAVPVADLAFTTGEKGKPTLALPVNGQDVQFNLTHSHDWALIAVSPRYAVGVDVEFMRNTINAVRIATRFFTSREKQAVLQASSDQRRKLFFEIWVRKEAYLKAVGTGLATGLSRVTVPLDSPTPIAFTPHQHLVTPDTNGSWVLHGLPVARHYAAALVVTGNVEQINTLQWTIDCCRMAEMTA